jgi:predicted Co/Zn/Cd cation transporter (cation efflux family)
MSAQQIIFAFLAALLPVIGVVLPGLLKQDKLSPQINSIIATVVVIVFAVGQSWSQNQIHLINPYLDFLAVLAVMSTLLSGPLKNLDAYLTSFAGIGATSKDTVVVAEPTIITGGPTSPLKTTDIPQ